MGEKLGGGVEPKVAHGATVWVAGPGAVVVEKVAGVLELLPFVVREDIAPRTMASGNGFEAAEFLHRVNFGLGKGDVRVLELQSPDDRWEVDGSPFEELTDAEIMTFVVGVGGEVGACAAWGERVAAEFGALRNYLQSGRVLPVDAEEGGGKVLRSLDDSV